MIGAIANIAIFLTLIFTGYSYFKDSRRKAKRETLEAYRTLQVTTLSKINKWLPSDIRAATENKKSDEYKELSGYLAEIECFCVGISDGIFDFDTFYKLSHGYFDSEKGLLKPRLAPLLEVKLDSENEDYFANLHKVWKRMDQKNHKYSKEFRRVQ